MNREHYKEIDKLRGIAILMVLLYHAVIVYPVNLHEVAWCSLLHGFLWYMEMPLFFMVSGFCYSCRKGEYGRYLNKKVKRLLIPHVFFGLLEILPRIIPNPLVREHMGVKDALWDFVVYGGGDWFLWTLFVIFAIFPLLDRLYHKGRAAKAGVLCAALLAYLLSYKMTNVLLIQMCAWFFIYFMAGYALRQADYDTFRVKLEQKPLWAAASMCVMLAVFGVNTLFAEYNHGVGRLLTPAGVLAGGVFFLWLAEKSRGLKERALVQCGTYSLQMYLLGSYALVATRTLLTVLMGIRMPIVIILGNFVLDTLFTLLVSHYILKRFSLFRFVSGLS